MSLAPNTIYTYALTGSARDFAIPFEYLARRFVTITLIGTDRRELVLTDEYRFVSKSIIQTTQAWGPADGYETLEVRRNTSATDRLVDYADGSILRAYELNISQIQTMHIAEEARNMVADTIGVNSDGDLDARGRRIVNLADATQPDHAVTLRQEQEWAISTLGHKNAAKASETASKVSELAAKASETASKVSELAAKASETVAIEARDVVLVVGEGVSVARLGAESARDEAFSARDEAGIDAGRAELAATTVEANRVPMFAPLWWPKRSSIPTGYVAADGQLLDRSTFPDAAAGVLSGIVPIVTEASWVTTPLARGNYTLGNGASTFRLPDYNGVYSGSHGGVFLRGTSGTGGQLLRDQIQNITGSLTGVVNRALFSGATTGAFLGAGSNSISYDPAGITVSGYEGASFDASRVARTGTETYPIHITGVWVIKLFGSVVNEGTLDLAALEARIATLEAAP